MVDIASLCAELHSHDAGGTPAAEFPDNPPGCGLPGQYPRFVEAREEDIDRITELFYRVLKGEIPPPLALPMDYPENEVKQVLEYANRFVAEYQTLADAMSTSPAFRATSSLTRIPVA